MSEIEKALVELKSLMKYRAQELGYEEEFRGLGLTSRKNLCLHPSVKREKSGAVVDARCRSLTAGFVREKKERGDDVDVCIYHDVCWQFLTVFKGSSSSVSMASQNLTVPLESRQTRASQFGSQWGMDSRRSITLRRGE